MEENRIENRNFVFKIILDTKFFQNFTRIDECYRINKSKFTRGIDKIIPPGYVNYKAEHIG